MSIQQIAVPAPATRTARNKRNLRALILSLLTPQEIWNLRKRYALGKETIMEMAKRSHCPPVLLYCVLTPLYSKTAMKLRMLRIESRVVPLYARAWSVRKIAKLLKIPEREIREYTVDLYSESTVRVRPWYHDRAPRPVDPNEILYDEGTLPPTSRLDWQNNQLSEIDEKRKGRCPECGRMMYLPCLPCRIQRDLIRGIIPKAAEFDPADEEDEVEPELLFL